MRKWTVNKAEQEEKEADENCEGKKMYDEDIREGNKDNILNALKTV